MTVKNNDASYPATGVMAAGMRTARQALFGVMLIGASTLISACGGCGTEPEEENKCADVECERGLCEVATGICINSDACDGDDNRCLEGFSCQDDGTCAAEMSCGTDGTCERGECVNGACVNPDSCTADDQCAEGSLCEGGECVDDLCADQTCERGVCSQDTGDCVNAVTCTEADEATDCVDGFKCDAQECVDEATFCERLDCDRGVCDFDSKSCVDAEDCSGEDEQCLDGKFCDDAGTCAANECLPEGSKCMGGGDCVPESGECVNPESCDEQSDCLPMNLCISGACVIESEACGADGCLGNQECFYNENELEAVCIENSDGCTTAVDCTDNRICTDGSCGPGLPCEDDDFEPNDATPTSYSAAQQGGLVSANVCSGDVDIYTFDTSQDPDDTGNSVLLVNLDYKASDIGLGDVKVELVNAAGTVVQEGVSDADGKVRLSQNIGVVTSGVYTIRVSDEGNVLSTGVFYDLYADVVDQNSINACDNPDELLADTPVTSSTIAGASTTLRSSCADRTGVAAEDIYRIELTERSYITAFADVDPTADVALSLRSDCLANDSEIGGACSERVGLGENETVNALVEPGTYFLVVQGDDALKGGSYTLSWSREDVVCTPADNECVDVDTARRCNATGTGFDTDECGASGCDMATGSCNRPAGDVCDSTSPTITKAQSPHTSAPIVWADLASDYDPGLGGCVPANAAGESVTTGADMTFEVTIPANHGMTATLTPSMGAEGDLSMYMVDDCLSLGACTEGVNDAGVGEAETMIVFNAEAVERVVYLVAESHMPGAGETAILSVELNEVICTPGERACTTDPVSGEDASGVCNTFGTGYVDLEACPFGCDAATNFCVAPPNDTCDGAVALTNGTTVSGTIDQYTNQHDVGDECSTTPSTSGGDAVYTIDLVQGDVVEAVVDSTFDSVIWVSGGCTPGEEDLPECVSASDTPERVEFIAPADGTYYVTVASYFSGRTGTYDLTVTSRTPDCTPGQPATCSANPGEIEYCDDLGFIQTFACGGTVTDCVNGACLEPQGDLCIDALPVTSGVTVSGNTADFTNTHAVGTECSSRPSTNGADAMYSIDLLAGDIVNAVVDSTFDSVVWASSVCTGAETMAGCVEASDTPEEIEFIAPADGVYYIGVAAWSSNGSGTYDLDVTVQQPVCTPGDPNSQTCISATELEYCDSRGLLQAVTCGGTTGACNGFACDEPQGDICADSIALNPNSELSGSVSGSLDDSDGTSSVEFPVGVTGACDVPAFSNSDGADTLYTINLEADDLLELTLDSSSSDAQIFVVENCGVLDSCLEFRNGPGLTYFRAPAAGTYSVIVDSDSTFTSASFDLDWRVLPGAICIPGGTACDIAGTSVEVCSDDGTAVDRVVTCATSCIEGSCEVVAADIETCDAAAPVIDASGIVVAMNFDDFVDDIDMPSSNCTGNQTDGPDAFFNVSVPPGEVLVVNINHPTGTFEEALLYIIEDCMDPENTCLDGATQNGTQDVGELAWFNSDATARVVTVGIDNESTAANNDAVVQIYTKAPDCTPGITTCDNTDPANGILELCSEDGLSTGYPCAGTCGQNVSGQCDTPTGDLCVDAVPLPTGSRITGTIDNYTSGNDVDGSSATCSSTTTAGRDVVYSVELEVGDEFTASLSGTFDTVLWLSSDCTADFEVDGCIDVDDGISRVENVSHTVTVAGTYYVTVAAYGSAGTGTFDLAVDYGPVVCTPGDPSVVTCANSTQLEICDDLGRLTPFTCGGNGNCAGVACEEPQGDFCFDQKLLNSMGEVAGQETGTFDDASRVSSTEFPADTVTGACDVGTGDNSDGVDTYYSVSLNAGDLLELDLTSTASTAQVFILESCGDINTCQSYTDGTGLTYFTAPTTGVYSIIVDNTSTFTSAAFTLDWRVLSGTICTPNAAACTGNDVSLCSNDGSSEDIVTCSSTCTDGACDVIAADSDICAMAATDVSTGSLLNIEWSTLTNDVNLASPNCTGSETDGNDAFFNVTVPPGQILQVQTVSSSSGTPLFYLTEDCAASAADDSCLAGSNNSAGLQWLNNTGVDANLVLGIDNTSTTASGVTVVEIKTIPSECAPGEILCDAVTGPEALSLCNPIGLYDSYSCSTTCGQVVPDACDVDSGDSCVDAIPLPIGGGVVTETIENFGNDYTVGTECARRPSTSGGDIVYSVEAMAGDVISASLSDTNTDFDSVLWASAACDSLTQMGQCIQAEDGFGDGGEELSFVVPEDGTYYIAVAAYFSSGEGDFELTVDVQVPICSLSDAPVCNGTGDAISFCSDLGLATTEYTCGGNGICAGGACDEPQGFICYDAIKVNPGGSQTLPAAFNFTANLDNSGNNSDAGDYANCGFTSGNGQENVYEIVLEDGQTLDVASTTTGANGILYLTESCVIGSACLAAANDTFTGGAEALNYVNNTGAAQTLYLFSDAFSDGDGGDLVLDITIQ